MRDLLFLSHRIPYPPDKGDKIRAWNMFRHLARTHRMHLGCFIDDPADWQHLPALRAMCADLACFPLDRRLARLKALLRLRPGQPLRSAISMTAGCNAGWMRSWPIRPSSRSSCIPRPWRTM